jgi:hypothetical protein
MNQLPLPSPARSDEPDLVKTARLEHDGWPLATRTVLLHRLVAVAGGSVEYSDPVLWPNKRDPFPSGDKAGAEAECSRG